MKKNLISVLILTLVFANFVLTAILMFTVLPQTKKANALIDKICTAIDLDLNSGAASGLGNVPVDQREEYKVNGGEDIYTSLAPSVSEEGGKTSIHHVAVKVTLVMNKESEKYETYNQEFMAGQDTTIQNSIIRVLGSYTKEDFEQQSVKEEIQETILQDMQELFGADYIVAVNFSKITAD